MVDPEFQRTEPENQPASDASIDLVALTQLNSSLERKLRYSVTVANHCALALEKERAESGDKLKKISFALLLERSAHQKRINNPTGARLFPTPAEVQARLADEAEKKKVAEHKRQAQMEHDLKRKRLRELALNDYLEQKAKQAAAWKATCLTPKSAKEMAEWNAHCLRAAARAAAAGRPFKVTFKDYKE